MKPDIKEAAEKSVVAVAGATATWTFHEVNQWVTLLVGAITFVYISVQLVFLLRKWRMLEKYDWQKIQSTLSDETVGEKDADPKT